MGEVNQARAYGVRVLPTSVRPGDAYWRVVEVRHLTPPENRGKHHIYVDLIDTAGQRVAADGLLIGWRWEGQRAEERAEPARLDKPLGEPMGNVPMNWGANVRIWISDPRRPSDAVEGLHTDWPDEPWGNEKWNTTGHHSFYVRFQLAQAGAVTPGGGTGGEGTGNGGTGGGSTGGNEGAPELVAMVQALRVEVAELRQFQQRWENFCRQMGSGV